MKKYLTPILFALGVLVIVGLVVWAMKSPDKPASDSSANPQVTATQKTQMETGHSQGLADAKVIVVEFGDYQCPACGVAHPVLKNSILPEFKDKIKFVFKNFPLTQIHKNAYVSALAAESAAAQGKFWEMHDILYEKQDEWVDLADPVDKFGEYAKSIGIDGDKLKSDVRSKKYANVVDDDAKLAADLKLSGTPTFFVNGKQIDIEGGGMNALRDAISQATTQ